MMRAVDAEEAARAQRIAPSLPEPMHGHSDKTRKEDEQIQPSVRSGQQSRTISEQAQANLLRSKIPDSS